MRLNKLFLFAAACAMSLAAMATDNGDGTYTNPVMDRDCPDPTVIRAADGYFYAYATGVSTYRSRDLVTWEYVTYPFNSVPSWNTDAGAGIWAPDINYIGGQYVMYYSLSAWGGEWTCGIGVATADAPDGKFTDHGKLFTSKEIGVQNSIDPCYFEEDGSKYLFWGSFHGIYGVELDKDGLSLEDDLEDVTPTKISDVSMEGTMIYKRGDYYYLLGSTGTCCEGLKSTYQLGVARSKSLFGPYVDKTGSTGHLTVIISKGTGTAGPGHCSEVITDDAGQTWLLYHAYSYYGMSDASAAEAKGRVLHLDQLLWDSDGWPYVEGGVPSHGHAKPVFNTSGINHPVVADGHGSARVYNLQGQRVPDSYKGVVVEDGKKMVKR